VKIKSQKDFWSGLMFVATGLGFAAGATNYSFGTSARPGPGYFPFGLGILLGVLGAVVLFKSLTVETEGGDPVGAIPWRPLGLITLGVVLFGVALPRLAIMISSGSEMIMPSLAGDEFKLKEVIVNIVILTVGSWAIFIKGLNLVIPLWPTFMTA
jgi:Tripartite tricarboxylate transporter TctB family